MVPPPGRLDGGRLIGGACGCDGGRSASMFGLRTSTRLGTSCCPRGRSAGGTPGTFPGGRGGLSLKIEPNWAAAGAFKHAKAVAAERAASRPAVSLDRTIRTGLSRGDKSVDSRTASARRVRLTWRMRRRKGGRASALIGARIQSAANGRPAQSPFSETGVPGDASALATRSRFAIRRVSRPTSSPASSSVKSRRTS
jgi:hypothetical protein